MFKTPKMTPPQAPPPPPNAPTLADASVALTGMRARQSMIGGIGSTIATGGQGITAPASLAGKSLLGS